MHRVVFDGTAHGEVAARRHAGAQPPQALAVLREHCAVRVEEVHCCFYTWMEIIYVNISRNKS